MLFCNNQVVKERTKLLKATDNGNGYYVVHLRKNGLRKMFYVHRLVANAFITNDNCYPVVNHKDYNKHNNNVNNLEWCTVKENVNYSVQKMKHEKKRCKTSNTGEKYISMYLSHKKYKTYRLTIKSKNICKCFKTLDNAIDYRNKVMENER